MTQTKILRMVAAAQKGDQKALSLLVEWGLDVLLEKHIEEGYLPIWVRVRLKRQLQKRHKAKAGRSDAITNRNVARGERIRSAIMAALENVSLHDKRMKELVRIVTEYLMRNGLDKFGLDESPCDETIKRVIRELKNN